MGECKEVNPNIFKCFHALGLVFHKVLNNWAKNVNNKTCSNWVFFRLLEIFFNTNIKSVLTFSNWKFEAQIMIKRVVKSQIHNLIIDH